jgi:hypothetical protein
MSKCPWALACALVVAAMGAKIVAQEEDPFGVGGEASTPTASAADKPASRPAPADYSPTAAEQRIERALDQPLRSPLSFVQTPLSQVMEQIREEFDIPILFDVAALEAAAITPDFEVTIDLNNVSLRAALDLMLKQIEGLTYIIDQEVLLVTTQDEADQRLRVVVYRVDDLVRVDNEGSVNSPDSYDFDSLIDILLSSVEKDSWEENGTGEGEMHSYPPGMLVVTTTSRVHDQIVRLLADMRRVKGEIEAAPADVAAGEARGPITRGIAIRAKSVDDSDASRQMVRNAIVQSVDWGSDGANTADHFLYVLPERVIVRHQPHVVRQVERVMANMGTSADRRGSRGGGGGFF